MLVSVCIPAYNAGPFIGECIRSVIAGGSQGVEIIVVDDGSTDDTVEEVKSIDDPRIHFHINPHNLGRAGNFARALNLATGQLLTLLPADCALPPDSIVHRVEALAAHPERAFVFGAAAFIGPSNESLGEHRPFETNRSTSPEETFRFLLPYNPVYVSTCMFRRTAYERTGGLRVHIAPSHRDWDLWLRMALHGGAAYLSEVVALERKHPENFTAAGLRLGHNAIYELIVLEAVRDWASKERPDLRSVVDASIRTWAEGYLDEAYLTRTANEGDRLAARSLGLALLGDPDLQRTARFMAVVLGGWLPFRSYLRVLRAGGTARSAIRRIMRRKSK